MLGWIGTAWLVGAAAAGPVDGTGSASLRSAAPGVLPTPPGDAACVSVPEGATGTRTDHVLVAVPDTLDPDLGPSVAAAVEHALQVEVVELGWPAPPGLGLVPLSVWVTEEAQGASVTSVVPCEGGGAAPLIRLDVAALDTPEQTDAVTAHEVHHAIHLGYGGEQPRWFWEASAVWMEALVHPHALWLAFTPGVLEHPELPLDAYTAQGPEGFLHAYGMALLMHLITDRQGPDAVRGLWEATAADDRPRAPLALLSADGADGEAVLDDFFLSLVLGDLPLQGGLGADDLDPLRPTGTVAGVGTHPLPGDDDPTVGPHGLAAYRIEVPAGHDVAVTFQGSEEAADWFAALVVVPPGGVGAVSTGGAALQAAHAGVPGGSAVWLLVSPRDDGLSRGDRPAWSAEVGVTAPADPVEAPDPAGCACGTGAPGGAWWIVPALLWPWRMRRLGGSPPRRPTRATGVRPTPEEDG